MFLYLLIGLVLIVFGVPAVRRAIVTRPVMGQIAKVLPRLGETEKIALESGTVSWEGQFFTGAPDWQKLLELPTATLSARERAFLAGPVEELCRDISDWEIHQLRDLPPDVWAHLKRHRYFGMIIPEADGGLGFSAAAHSAVIVKLASRSPALAVTAMVPNSLGPAELLLHYGTPAQKSHWLPKLASGEEIPCFALTGPEAGSDAAATQSTGVITMGAHEGTSTLGIRLNWKKRYITLGPVSTVIGLAFRLHDPEGLLGDQEDLGITCALVPSHLPGISIGERHDPLGIPFSNGPNEGRDVFVPLDAVIGGRAGIGQGWRMLMECLAAGRAISLPALSTAGVEVCTRIVAAHAAVREQFDTPIGRFEGIEEPLARIGGTAYLANAARRLTVAQIDQGQRPAVLSAIMKAYLTQAMRDVVNDAMDIRAGAGISRGPRNLLAGFYTSAPIGITVEGANILTRSMIIYGQGAIRCHPYVSREVAAIEKKDVAEFERAFFGHAWMGLKNAVRAPLHALTGSWFARVPTGAPTALLPAFREFTRLSAAFSLISDVTLAAVGGKLKRKEKLSGRLADALAWLTLGSAVLHRYVSEGAIAADLPSARWGTELAIQRVKHAFRGVLDNYPSRGIATLLRLAIFPFGVGQREPSDALGAEIARGMLEDGAFVDRLSPDVYVPDPRELGLGRLEAALKQATGAWEVETKIRDAVRAGALDRAPGDAMLGLAVKAGVIGEEERQRVIEAHAIRDEVIQVDAFTPEEYARLRA